jgi:tetratricopeptide (TPR) repeat protein
MSRDVLFNPSFLSDEQAIRQFIIRHELLRAVLDDLEADYAPINPHSIVIGARGFGKSSLLRRVTAEINTRPELRARWFPVVFPEEPYEVGNLGELWLEALGVVARSTGDAAITRLRDELHQDLDADRVGRIARDALRRFAEVRGVRLVLVIENLDMLLTDNLSEAEAWALRGALQTEPCFYLLASAVRRFEGLTEHDKPFYDSLRRLELPPLNAEEIDQLWGDVSGRAPGLNRAKALRVLTGGNPRMVRLLAQLAQGHRLRDILSDLSGLIDRHTDYFKGNIEALSGQQRRVFLAVANLWRPAAAAAIAAEARLDNNVTSVALQRLERQGRLEVVGKKGKNRLYQISERLYNIYYLMRRGQGIDARIQAVVDFMVHFYEPPELGGLVERLLAEPERGGERPSFDVVCGLMAAHRKNTDARAAVIGPLTEDVVSQLPKKELELAMTRPKELLALLEGPAGHRFVDAAERMLRRSLSHDLVRARIAEEVLRRDPDGATWAAFYLVWLTPDNGLQVFDGPGTSAAARLNLAITASVRAIFVIDRRFAAEWLTRAEQHKLLEDEANRDGRSALRVMSRSPGWEGEVPGAVGVASGVPIMLRNLILSCFGHESALKSLQAELATLEPTPLHMAALALVCSARSDRDTLASLVEPLTAACESHRLVSVGVAAFYCDAGQPERALSYLREHANTLNPLARLAFLLRLGASMSEIQVAWVDSASHWPGEPALWELLHLTDPGAVLAGWRSLTEPQRAAVAPSLVFGAARSSERRVWELAVSAFEEHAASVEQPNLVAHTAWLYGRLGRPDKALAILERSLGRDDAATEGEQVVTDLALALAAAGLGAAVATSLRQCRHLQALSPLLLALEPDGLGETPAAEELAIAADLRERLQKMAECPDLWVQFTPSAELPFPRFDLEEFDIPKAKPKKPRAKQRPQG